MTVYVSRGDVNRALRRLKKKLDREGLMAEAKRREFYRKLSELRREAARRAIKRAA
jgi:ribosomal protein S21